MKVPIYLTGSRFFGWARPDSDYDFFAGYTTEMREYLRRQGYVRVQDNRHSAEAFVREVWRRGNIEVQLVKDVELKRQARDYIARNAELRMLLRFANKKRRQWIWKLALERVSVDKQKAKHIAIEVGTWGWRIVRLLSASGLLRIKNFDKVAPVADAIVSEIQSKG